ncbi:hypothetical protein CEXT_406361 [Caerostris extrusa]|uniref:Uncharacterized protein n=1 Tax=Caerostris extrusa TaxID=172846 RepID=A0AAV4QP00_CAEEX|nr:hypothetical protein CEXT_406361 [Caerostris extrusa]
MTYDDGQLVTSITSMQESIGTISGLIPLETDELPTGLSVVTGFVLPGEYPDSMAQTSMTYLSPNPTSLLGNRLPYRSRYPSGKNLSDPKI